MRRPALVFACLLVAAASAAEVRVVEVKLWPPGAVAEGAGEKVEKRWGNRWLTGVGNATLSVYLPAAGDAPVAAVVVFPGGAYAGQAIDHEGHAVARWLAERGVAGVVAPYRCGGGANRHPVPLSDGMRAVRQVRAHADGWGIDPDRVGVMGFSAGGHLAATVATQVGPLEGVTDDLTESPRPDFAVLIYPVISLREGLTHGGSRNNLLGKAPSDALVAAGSADERVSPTTPHTLLIHAADDAGVPVENSQKFFDACRRHGVPTELHVYETGGHGFGMRPLEGSVAGWTGVLEGWLTARGVIVP